MGNTPPAKAGGVLTKQSNPGFTGDHVQEINLGTSHAAVVKNLPECLFYPNYSSYKNKVVLYFKPDST
jgi:hypothetical protein